MHWGKVLFSCHHSKGEEPTPPVNYMASLTHTIVDQGYVQSCSGDTCSLWKTFHGPLSFSCLRHILYYAVEPSLHTWWWKDPLMFNNFIHIWNVFIAMPEEARLKASYWVIIHFIRVWTNVGFADDNLQATLKVYLGCWDVTSICNPCSQFEIYSGLPLRFTWKTSTKKDSKPFYCLIWSTFKSVSTCIFDWCMSILLYILFCPATCMGGN